MKGLPKWLILGFLFRESRNAAKSMKIIARNVCTIHTKISYYYTIITKLLFKLPRPFFYSQPCYPRAVPPIKRVVRGSTKGHPSPGGKCHGSLVCFLWDKQLASLVGIAHLSLALWEAGPQLSHPLAAQARSMSLPSACILVHIDLHQYFALLFSRPCMNPLSGAIVYCLAFARVGAARSWAG